MGSAGEMPAIVKGACGKGGKHAPSRDAREAAHNGEQSQRGNNRTRRIKLARMQAAARRQLRARNEQGHKIGRKHAKGHAKARNIDQNAQRDGNNRRKRRGRSDHAVRLLALLAFVQHGHHAEHRRDNETRTQANHKTAAPNKQLNARRKRTQ